MNLKLNSQFVARTIDDNLIIINKYEASEIYKFTSIYKSIILEVFDNGTLEDVVDKVKKQYHNRINLNTDINRCVSDLVELKIIEVNNG